MSMRDLIPWGRNQQAPSRYRDDGDPFMTLHREMNRLFDDVFRGLDIPQIPATGWMPNWPNVEVIETSTDVKVSAELPGMDEKDVEVFMSDGSLIVRGEKKSEIEDKERAFSERSYGRFERRIPLGWEIEEDKVNASFTNGVLTVTLPKSSKPSAQMKRIAINREDATKH